MTAPATAPAGVNLRALLEEMIERDASDLHITAGERPKLRIDGDIQNSNIDYVLTPKDTLTLAYSVLTENQKKRFELEDELDFSFGIQNLARFRGNCFKQRGCVSMVIRQIPFNIRTFEELGLAGGHREDGGKAARPGARHRPTGSGKSTTLAAMIDKINRERRGHIITVEDPIEFIHRHQNCIVNQREVGSDTKSFANALKYALREDPDVILDRRNARPGDHPGGPDHRRNRSPRVRHAAHELGGRGDQPHHRRLPVHQQSQVRAQLAFVLEGIVTQTLLPSAQAGVAASMAAEILVVTPAIRALIRDDKIHQIYSSMQSGKKFGMQTLNDALYQLYMSREVTADECPPRLGRPERVPAHDRAARRSADENPVDGKGQKPNRVHRQQARARRPCGSSNVR